MAQTFWDIFDAIKQNGWVDIKKLAFLFIFFLNSQSLFYGFIGRLFITFVAISAGPMVPHFLTGQVVQSLLVLQVSEPNLTL